MPICTHHQVLGDPVPSHPRFAAQSPGDLDFFLVPLPPFFQVRRVPATPRQLVGEQALGLDLGSFEPLAAIVMPANSFAHLRQQFRAEFFSAKTPAPSQRFPVSGRLALPPLLNPPLKLLTSRRTGFGRAHLAEHPVNPQPGRALPRRLELFRIAAPRSLPTM